MASQETDSRAPRQTESRDDTKRAMAWEPSPLLPAPNDVDGYDFRYVRASVRGSVDNVNISQARRDGWEPVKAADVPELKVISDRESPFPDSVLIGGLLLCKRPSEIGEYRTNQANDEMQKMIQAVDTNYLKEQDTRTGMVKFADRESNIRFGGK